MMKKSFVVSLVISLFILFSNFANATTVEWLANPSNENTFQYTLYFNKLSEPGNITKVNTPVNGISLNGSLEKFQTYVFYATSWNRNLSGDAVESPKSVPVNYTVPGVVEEQTEPSRPSGIHLKLITPTQPAIVTGPCSKVDVFRIYSNSKLIKEYMPEVDDSLKINIIDLIKGHWGLLKIKIIAENDIGDSYPIEFWLSVSENRRKIIYKIDTIDKIERADPTYLGAFKLDELVVEVTK